MLNPNDNPLIGDPNIVNRNAPYFYQMFGTLAKVVVLDEKTGHQREYKLADRAAQQRFYGRRTALERVDYTKIEMLCSMTEGSNLPNHDFVFTFDNYDDVHALLRNMLWLH